MTTQYYKWVGRPFLGAKYRTQSEASKHIHLGAYPLRVDFRFEIVWIVMPSNGEIATVTTPTGRRLIGYNDPYMNAHGRAEIEQFCAALCERQVAQ